MTTFTKRVLANGLKELMNQKTIDQITVKELVEYCGITRQTFYYHFQDIYELLEWIFENEFLNYIKDNVTQRDWQEDFLMIFRYIKEHRNFCLNSFFSVEGGRLAKYFHTASFQLLSKVFFEFPEAQQLPQSESEFIIDFYCYAFAGVVTEWMMSGMRGEPEVIVARLSKLMEGVFPEAIQRFLK